MKSKIITAIAAGSLIVGMVALSGCYESSYPGYGYGGYGYGYGRGYYSDPVVVGDYDEHRSWWGGHRDRDRDEDREEWHEQHERHEHEGHDHDRD
jgi:hypothetical protein